MAKILVIDEDNFFLSLLVYWLEEHRFQVTSTHNAWLSFQLLKQQLPDLIVCHSELNGYRVLRVLRQDPVTHKIPFIFIKSEPIRSKDYPIQLLDVEDTLTQFCTIEDLIPAIKAQLQSMH